MPKKKETNKIKAGELFAEFPNLYETASEDDMNATFEFAEEYKMFLDNSKTEREFAANAIQAAEELGYVDIASKETLKPGDKVWINYIGEDTTDLARALVKEVYAAGGLPFPHCENQRVHREMLMNCSKEQLDLMCRTDSLMMSGMDCFIGVRAAENASELSDVPTEKMSLYNQLYSSPVHHGIRVPKTRWVVLRYPTPAMAQLMDSSFEEFEDFYYNVCNLDYAKMGRAMQNLVDLMNRSASWRKIRISRSR